MHIDKRTEARLIVNRQPLGKLQLIMGESCFNVTSVIDFSPTGIQLKACSNVNIGENIWVRYIDEKVDLKLRGTVVWISDSFSKSVEVDLSESHLIGIEFATPSLLEAVLLN